VVRGASRVDDVSRWLTSFGDAWESGDVEGAGVLFAVDATLQATPFSDLLRGRRQILGHFREVFGDWPGATFSAQVLGAGDTYGVAHYRVASHDRAIDGVLVAALDDRGRCTSLRQWWHETGGSGSSRM
jgi:SnoaL-like protein